MTTTARILRRRRPEQSNSAGSMDASTDWSIGVHSREVSARGIGLCKRNAATRDVMTMSSREGCAWRMERGTRACIKQVDQGGFMHETRRAKKKMQPQWVRKPGQKRRRLHKTRRPEANLRLGRMRLSGVQKRCLLETPTHRAVRGRQ